MHQDRSASAYYASCEAREGIPARHQQVHLMLCLKTGDDMLHECPSKPWRLHCSAVPPGTEVSRRCVDNAAAAEAGSDGELRPQAASSKAGYAGGAGASKG